jgi:hypothetical protein
MQADQLGCPVKIRWPSGDDRSSIGAGTPSLGCDPLLFGSLSVPVGVLVTSGARWFSPSKAGRPPVPAHGREEIDD